MKKLFALVLCFLSVSCFASSSPNQTFAQICPKATAMNNPGFCQSFKTAATCHCTAAGVPAGMCQDMNTLYARMIAIFGTVENACTIEHQGPDHVSQQICIENWKCYRSGGNSSDGLCSGTGRAC